MDLGVIAKLGANLNLLHGFIYFAPEAAEEYRSLGLTDAQPYFASRAAPLGAVPAEVVVATFFNFNPEFVRAAIPSAWDVAKPTDIEAARLRGARRVLDRAWADIDPTHIDEASEIVGSVIANIGFEGRPLAAANSSIALPDDAHTCLWQQITVLREWRGDAHVAALVSAPVNALEALVLHAGTGQVPADILMRTRHWSESAWAETLSRFVELGLTDSDGSLTEAGQEFRGDIENRTDRACHAMAESIGEEQVTRLLELLRPLRRALQADGAFARLGG
ncbi:MAG: hypothetical protein IH940_00760 [Acidobacteria bacterium]|nr:hypothetical protein [Acidobacteriota bacterium]